MNRAYKLGLMTYRKDKIALERILRLSLNQSVTSGVEEDYFGILIVSNPMTWIASWINRPGGNFDRAEKWIPIFECGTVDKLQIALDSADDNEHFFKLWFRGIPENVQDCNLDGSAKRRLHQNIFDRKVRIREVSDVIGVIPRTIDQDFFTIKTGDTYDEVIALMGKPGSESLVKITHQQQIDAFNRKYGLSVSIGTPYRHLHYTDDGYEYSVGLTQFKGCWQVYDCFRYEGRWRL